MKENMFMLLLCLRFSFGLPLCEVTNDIYLLTYLPAFMTSIADAEGPHNKPQIRKITLKVAYNMETSPPQSHLGTVHLYASWQIMHLSAACACAMSTADKSSYSAIGTLHP